MDIRDYKYVVASALLTYSDSDLGSGRCRLPRALFESLNLRLGSAVVWAIGDRRLICTSWPDTLNALRDDEVCLDPTVFSKSEQDIFSPPIECSIPPFGLCRLVKSVAARVGSSVHASSIIPNVSLGMLHGLPLAASSIVTANPRLGRPAHVVISSVQPGEICLAGLGTIVVNSVTALSSSASFSDSMPHKPTGPHQPEPPRICTSVVTHLIRTVVHPAIHLTPTQRCHGVLLLGPPGVGKTFAVRAVQRAASRWCRVEVREVSIASLLVAENPLSVLVSVLDGQTVGGVSSEASLPQVIFLVVDEIDALGRPPGQSDKQASVSLALCNWLDAQSRSLGRGVVGERADTTRCIVATTNHAAQVDPRLRRAGRLEREVEVTITSDDRRALLTGLTAHVFCGGGVGGGGGSGDNGEIWRVACEKAASDVAVKTGGYVAADLAALVAEALGPDGGAENVGTGVSLDLDHTEASALLADQLADRLTRAMTKVPPSALRGATVALPDLSYADVVGHDQVKAALRRVLAFCSTDPSVLRRAQRLGLTSAGGVLLHGPPGNSKTRLVMAVAASHSLPVISLSSADVYSPYVGDAEAEVRRAFRLARQSAPCVLFLDEMDALVTDRSADGGSGGSGGGASVEARVLATLLTEMDGIDGKHGVVVLGATNRLDCIDSALLRKGRFHHLLLVPPPNEDEAPALLRYFAAKSPFILAQRVDELVAVLRPGISGADIENLVREESMSLMRSVVK